MKSKPRICVTCGTSYEYCPKCAQDENKPMWMMAFDTEECKDVYGVIARYNTKDLTKEEAQKELDKIISHKIKFTKPIQEQVNEIIKKEEIEQSKPIVKHKKIVTEN